MQQIEKKNTISNEVSFEDLPDAAIKIYKLFDKVDRIDFRYIKEKTKESDSKIKRNLILLQDKKLIKKHGVTNGCWYSENKKDE